MLIHPWDAPHDDTEWQALARRPRLRPTGRQRPTRRTPRSSNPPLHAYDPERSEAITHLARPNPCGARALESNPQVVLSVVDVTTCSSPRPLAGGLGRPTRNTASRTSFYAAVQLRCTAHLVDDPTEKATLLNRRIAHFQPEGGSPTPVTLGRATHRRPPAVRRIRAPTPSKSPASAPGSARGQAVGRGPGPHR
ncbi:FMN-binding negative transcriptional regulator [Streptomyces sp. L7]